MKEFYDKRLQIKGGTVVKYIGNAEEVKIPSTVKRIAPFAFADCKSLKKVITPVGLMSIGKGAFYGCINLKEAIIPGRLFRRVNGGKVFPDGVDIYFRFYASAGVPLEDEDYSDAFENEQEYELSGIEDASMFDNLGLPVVDVETKSADSGLSASPEGASGEPSDKPHIAETEAVISEPITAKAEPVVEEEISDGYPETLQEKMEAIIPVEEQVNPARTDIENIGEYIISGDVLVKYIGTSRTAVVPEYITRIGENAFSNCSVESVTLPQGLVVISKNAFSWCRSLKTINLPEGLQMIDDGAFASCESLEHIAFPSTLKFIGADAFRACSGLLDLILPESITAINRRAFDFCVMIENVDLPPKITVLEEGVFSHCERLRRVTLPKNLKVLCAWAFAECYELREINFPKGLLSIGEVAFMNCRSLVAVDLPMSLKQLGRQSFIGCTSLCLVNLPASLEKQVKPSKAFHRLQSVIFNYAEEETYPTQGNPSAGDGV